MRSTARPRGSRKMSQLTRPVKDKIGAGRVEAFRPAGLEAARKIPESLAAEAAGFG